MNEKENLQKAKEAIEALCKNKENVSVEDIDKAIWYLQRYKKEIAES